MQTEVRIERKQNAFNKRFDHWMDTSVRVLTYATGSFLLLMLLLFAYLNSLQFHYFIDEKFHIPQTLRYCKGKFWYWDPKITTLPALYLLSALIYGPLHMCTITYLRFINVICTYINLFLTSEIVTILNYNNSKEAPVKKLKNYVIYLTAWNITFFPPLFFWFFLYYTDTFSVTLILLMLLFHLHNRSNLSAFIGVLSICVRQTNIIWVVFLGIEKGLTVVEEVTKKPHFTDCFNVFPCIRVLYKMCKAKAKQGTGPFFSFMKSLIGPVFPHLLTLILFISFVIYNGGIVVGDRSAHVATFHFAQIFYYSVFVFCFSWPYLLPNLLTCFKFIRRNIIISILFVCFIAIVVHFNTLVHPYILADNRHYSFYIWKNLMNRFSFFKYLLIPLYALAIYAILESLTHIRLLSVISYFLCVCLVLVPQLLLEPRYFIIPYILFRLHQKTPENWQIVGETITTCIVLIAQFTIFIFKEFPWADEKYPQRITW